MDAKTFFLYLFVMVGVTYLVRVIPYIAMRREVKNRFFKSFLYYIPYTVLAVMTMPAILYATDSMFSAAAGLLVGIIVAYFGNGLLVVAMSCCGAVFIVEMLMKYVFHLL